MWLTSYQEKCTVKSWASQVDTHIVTDHAYIYEISMSLHYIAAVICSTSNLTILNFIGKVIHLLGSRKDTFPPVLNFLNSYWLIDKLLPIGWFHMCECDWSYIKDGVNYGISRLFPTCLDIFQVLWRGQMPQEESNGLTQRPKATKQPSAGARKRGTWASQYSSLVWNGSSEAGLISTLPQLAACNCRCP